MSKTVLITGGAGYIGSHAVYAFQEQGWNVVVLDNLSAGIHQNISSSATFIQVDLSQADTVDKVISAYKPEAIVHFAGSIIVPESVRDPLKYYNNNTNVTRKLLECAIKNNVKAFLFSSTAAVYGEPKNVPIDEDAPLLPINPYGSSKLASEYIVKDCGVAYGLQYGILRYFNVAGADGLGRTGQSSLEATHLIKVACEVVVGKREKLSIFGVDYPTKDGTCIRDYIHVTDLVNAHVSALNYLIDSKKNLILNCGYGRGYSVRDVILAIERVTGKPLKFEIAARREGDPVSLIADNSRILSTLDWQPQYDNLDVIIETALSWEKTLTARVQ